MKAASLNKKNMKNGIIAGLVAGVVLGFMMLKMGIMGNMGAMIGMPNPFAGFVFHLVVSAIIGVIFAAIFYKLINELFHAIIWGAVYGIIWWFLGTLTLAQMAMGMPVAWTAAAMTHGVHMLMAQIIFGVVLSLSYFWLKNRK